MMGTKLEMRSAKLNTNAEQEIGQTKLRRMTEEIQRSRA